MFSKLNLLNSNSYQGRMTNDEWRSQQLTLIVSTYLVVPIVAQSMNYCFNGKDWYTVGWTMPTSLKERDIQLNTNSTAMWLREAYGSGKKCVNGLGWWGDKPTLVVNLELPSQELNICRVILNKPRNLGELQAARHNSLTRLIA